MSKKRKQRRRENYNRLRSVGFTAEQANKLKDRSRRTISKIVEIAKDLVPNARDTLARITEEVIKNDKEAS